MVKSAADIVHKVLDPVLAKRAGLSMALVDAWPQIAGDRLAAQCMPVKVNWPRRAGPDDPFAPGTLIVAAEALAALHIQHQSAEILSRINSFIGFEAIDRLKITQKTVSGSPKPVKSPKRDLSPAEQSRLDQLAEGFEDEALAQSVRRLGVSVLSAKGRH